MGKNDSDAYNRRLKERNARKRRARLRQARALGSHPKERWPAIQELFCGLCVRCLAAGRWPAPGGTVKDHIRPLYRGGDDSVRNIQPLCPPCNNSKGPDPVDYRPEALRVLAEGGRTA